MMFIIDLHSRICSKGGPVSSRLVTFAPGSWLAVFSCGCAEALACLPAPAALPPLLLLLPLLLFLRLLFLLGGLIAHDHV